MDKRSISLLIIIVLVISGASYVLSRIKKKDIKPPIFKETVINIVPLEKSTIKNISQNIGDLSPEKAVLGGHWQITRFDLIDNNHLYVEYEDGHIKRRILLEKNGANWNVLGLFKPGKDMWQLIKGKDPYMGKDLSVYELSQDGSNWELVK